MKLTFCLLVFLAFIQGVVSEPWIDTRDSWLRADIEVLADIDVIKVPITTYPLMWSSIIKDLDNTPIEKVPGAYKDIYWRVKTLGKNALKRITHKEINLFYSNAKSEFRVFGDGNRGEKAISARNTGLSHSIAWNLEVTHRENFGGSNKTYFDGSYFSFVNGNWVTSIGAIEKWWGPGMISSGILSNHERPSFGVDLQRNYSNQAANNMFAWLGPWTLNVFYADLERKHEMLGDEQFGLSLEFKPLDSLNIGIRAKSWHGKTNQLNDEIIDTPFNRFTANTAKDGDEHSDDKSIRNYGIDFKWRVPTEYPLNFYMGRYVQDDDAVVPANVAYQYGLTASAIWNGAAYKWFVESNRDSSGQYDISDSYKDALEQHIEYQLLNLADKNLYDLNSIGLIFSLNKSNKLTAIYTDIERVQSGANLFVDKGFLTSPQVNTASRLNLKWQYQTYSYGEFELNLMQFNNHEEVSAKNITEYYFSVNWAYPLD